jgi:hypothetical protein
LRPSAVGEGRRTWRFDKKVGPELRSFPANAAFMGIPALKPTASHSNVLCITDSKPRRDKNDRLLAECGAGWNACNVLWAPRRQHTPVRLIEFTTTNPPAFTGGREYFQAVESLQ